MDSETDKRILDVLASSGMDIVPKAWKKKVFIYRLAALLNLDKNSLTEYISQNAGEKFNTITSSPRVLGDNEHVLISQMKADYVAQLDRLGVSKPNFDTNSGKKLGEFDVANRFIQMRKKVKALVASQPPLKLRAELLDGYSDYFRPEKSESVSSVKAILKK